MGIYSCIQKESRPGLIGNIQFGGFLVKGKTVLLRAKEDGGITMMPLIAGLGLVGIVVGMLVVLRWYEKKYPDEHKHTY